MKKSVIASNSSGIGLSSSTIALNPDGLISTQAYQSSSSYGKDIVAELLSDPDLRKALVEALAVELRQELSPLLQALK